MKRNKNKNYEEIKPLSKYYLKEEDNHKIYTKNVGIGLARNYDINEVIKYLTGDGELVLSDEPDKVSLASIFHDVDYERLLQVRKATVKFHVQPFKYLKDEIRL